MATEHIVVDGSNIATEGRSEPSLAQLEEAVSELRRERPDAEVTVIVDATFSHRIDPSELERFEKAALEGEYVHPPAGAIGRGDAFLLRIGEKVDATILSNDSFQEFHAEHPWLFERGRLLGATPVPGVGWIFTPRSPVRGPKSRRALKDSDRAKKQVTKAILAATREAVAPGATRERKKESADGKQGLGAARRPSVVAAAAVNDPLTFVSFIAEHPLGTEVEGQVDSYTSHGAVVMVGKTQGYAPLANLADPPPRSPREVLKKGEHRRFVVTALDPQRRGVELSLPGVGQVSGRPSDATIAAELQIVKKSGRAKKVPTTKKAASSLKKAERSTKAATTKKARAETEAAPVKADSTKEAAPVKKQSLPEKELGLLPEQAPAKRQGAEVRKQAAPAKKQTAAKKVSSDQRAGKRQAAPRKRAASPSKEAAKAPQPAKSSVARKKVKSAAPRQEKRPQAAKKTTQVPRA